LRRGTIFVADAHCDDGKRYIVRADEKLTAFVELESILSIFPALSISAKGWKSKDSEALTRLRLPRSICSLEHKNAAAPSLGAHIAQTNWKTSAARIRLRTSRQSHARARAAIFAEFSDVVSHASEQSS
jgi:hypothetical protein